VNLYSDYNIVEGNTFKTLGIVNSGNYSSITSNTFTTFSGSYAIYNTGENNKIYQNSIPDSTKLLYNSKTSTKTENDVYTTTEIFTMSGTASQTIDVTIPDGQFSSKPRIGFLLGNDANFKVVGAYLFDDTNTTNTNARFSITALTGTLPTGGIRFSIYLSK
jgi:hypothetical protein